MKKSFIFTPSAVVWGGSLSIWGRWGTVSLGFSFWITGNGTSSGISGSLAIGTLVSSTLVSSACSGMRFLFFDGLDPDNRDPAGEALRLAVAFSAAARVILVDGPGVAATG